MFDPVDGSELRPDRLQPAVRDLAGDRVHLPRRRRSRATLLRGARPRASAHLRDGRVRARARELAHGRTQDWDEPLRAWVEGSGCDALLLRYAVHEPLDYAAGWNRPLRADTAAYAAALDRWTGYFRRARDRGDLLGRDHPPPPQRARTGLGVRPSSDRITGASDQVLRLFDARTPRRARPERAPPGRALTLAPDHRLDQTSRIEAGTRVVERTVLRLGDGFASRSLRSGNRRSVSRSSTAGACCATFLSRPRSRPRLDAVRAIRRECAPGRPAADRARVSRLVGGIRLPTWGSPVTSR